MPTLANPFFAPLVLGVQRAAEAEDRYALVVASEYSHDREKALIERLSREVDGFVMVSPVGGDRFLRAIARERSLVLVDRKVGRVPAVLIDTPSGLAELTTRLLAKGHTRVGYISGPQHSWLDAQRLASVQAAAEAGGATVSVFGPLPPTVDAGLTVAEAVAESGVTAIMAYNSSIVLGMITGLGPAAGFGAQEIAVACADSLIDFRHHAGISITTLDAPVEKAGFVAMRKLSALLAGESTRPVDVLPTQVVGWPGTGVPAVTKQSAKARHGHTHNSRLRSGS